MKVGGSGQEGQGKTFMTEKWKTQCQQTKCVRKDENKKKGEEKKNQRLCKWNFFTMSMG